ncbi:hypothetical protein EOL96_02860 [Candidatus Saccharibacteria bacterium]|nr:hypothetical protein [Candidatus Saccharibacteria bacterium]
MQPQQEQSEDWQQPPQAPAQAPYQAVAAEPEVQSAPTGPVPNAVPEVISQDQHITTQQTHDDDEGDADIEQYDNTDQPMLRWEATEYIHQPQSPLWFVIFAIIVVGLMVVAFLLMKSITFAILIPVMAVALVVYVKRPPTVNQYILSRKGLHINDRLYPYATFRSFGVLSQGGAHSVVLTPRKRFQLGHTLYFPEEVGEPLVDMLAERLPMKDATPDMIDKLLAKLRL